MLLAPVDQTYTTSHPDTTVLMDEISVQYTSHYFQITLRCVPCKLNYGYEKSGNKSLGQRFYDNPRDAIMATDGVFVDRHVYSLQWSFA